MGTVAILRWTGRGTIADLESSVNGVLRAERMRAKVHAQGASIVVGGSAPVGVAILFQYLPGLSWIAVGHSADSLNGLAKAGAILARSYLKKRGTFSVSAESTSGQIASSDLGGAISSAILEEARGSRIDEVKPSTIFRAAFDGNHGVVGVQLKKGPGGTPVGNEKVDCLVSGGMHSAVVAWHALLCGYSVRLVHARVSEESERAVARLYAELSNRVDPAKLSLLVSDQGSVMPVLKKIGRRSGHPPLAGFHSQCGTLPRVLESKIDAPLYLLTEEEFETSYAGLSLLSFASRASWRHEKVGTPSWKFFGGARTDMHGVLDGLSSRPP